FLFTMSITVTTAIGAVGTGLVQDKIGARRTVTFFVFMWALTSIGMALLPQDHSHDWPLWVLGNGVGLALGGIGTSSRSMVGIFPPRHKQAEFFGLWGLTVKLAAVAGAPAFGVIKSNWGNQVAFAVCGALCIIALGLMFLVNEAAGRKAAHDADLAS